MPRLTVQTLPVVLALLLAAAAADAAESSSIEEIYIIGDPSQIETIAGSAFMLTDEELKKFEFSDIHRIVRQAPGVYFQEEDGYGLRPNIGIRGSGGGRSAKINIMEDGILIAPAPYAAPEAYYFPTTARISNIEILKGPQTLRYGPFTVGGTINLVSTPIPDSYSGSVNIETGPYGEQRQHAWYGGAGEQLGFLLESHQHNSEGFHDIARNNRDSGFDKQDYMAKLQWRSTAGSGLSQRLELKVLRAEETSNSSYVGLSEADFERTPYARYGLTELDQMNNEQETVTLRHRLDFSDTLNLSTSIYRTDFHRNWYKVDSINGQSITGIIGLANSDDAAAIGILNGTTDTTNIRLKNNDRAYYAKGAQVELSGRSEGAGMTHNWVAGMRQHEDEVDRLQPVDVFDQINGSLAFSAAIDPTGAGDNRVETAEAFSAWLQDRITVGDWQLIASLRFEDIETARRDYANNVDRSAPPSAVADNSVDAVLAGFGFTYALTEGWQLLAGAHQGFAPPGGGAIDGTDPEESTNYELGVRYRTDSLSMDAIGFYSDYQNTVFNCSVANPCTDGRDSGTESLGKAEIRGLELGLDATLLSGNSLNVPLRLSYTWTDGEISEDSDTGNVLAGDAFQYLPETVFNAVIGVEHNSGWNAYLSASRIDEMCIDFSCNRTGIDDRFLKTDAYSVLDLSVSRTLSDDAEVYVKIDNALDDAAIVARSPAGARVNKPRTTLFGLRLAF